MKGIGRMRLEPVPPINVIHLFPAMRVALLDLLRALSDEEWQLPTVCTGWTVKDVAQHILGDDVGNLSRRRDGYKLIADIDGLDELIAFINNWNEEWVRATRRLSPRLLCDLLAITGPQVHEYYASLDLSAMGGGVGWTGNESDPVWLDVAREYTEYWLHQQHIRDAVNKPGLKEPRFFAPLLATFMHGVPHAYRDIGAADGTLITLVITGEAGNTWHIARTGGRWRLYAASDLTPVSTVTMDAETAWRLFTKGISQDEAAQHTVFEGDEALGRVALDAVSILA